MNDSWTLLALSHDLPDLYNEARRGLAQEHESRSFWTAVLESWKSMQNVALRIFAEVPPDPDPASDYRLRRVDITVQGYEDATHRRLVLLFLEA